MRLLDISYVVISEKGGGSCTAAQNKQSIISETQSLNKEKLIEKSIMMLDFPGNQTLLYKGFDQLQCL